MPFTGRRYQEIEAELGHIYERLLALALEIEENTPGKDRRGRTYEAAMDAAIQVFNLRETLRKDQEPGE